MFCSNCGKEVFEDAKFCPECGHNLKGGNNISRDDKAHCPKCDSTDITVGKRGYNSQAIVWTFIAIILGFLTFGVAWIVLIILLLIGFIGSNETQWICKKCGYKWGQKQKLNHLDN